MIIKSLDPLRSFAFLQANPNAILIDCRSSMEFLFVGHPVGAVHIPWIDEPTWDVNPNFVTEIQKTLQMKGSPEPSVPILLICRSGRRSLDAGKALLQAGFQEIYNVEEGFEGERNGLHQRSTLGGWRFCGLPWEQC
ncbi:Rhodanese domain protein [Gammaproteobacteria bacterium]